MKNLKFKGAVLLLLMGMALPLAAQPKGSGCGKSNAPKCEKFLPDLSDEQQAAIEKLRVDHMSAMQVMRADEDVLRAELNRLEVDSKYNQKAVDAKIDELYDLKAKMAKEKTKHHQDVRSLLTDEQKVAFDARQGCRMGHGHGNGQGFGAGDGTGQGKQGCAPACDGQGPKRQKGVN